VIRFFDYQLLADHFGRKIMWELVVHLYSQPQKLTR